MTWWRRGLREKSSELNILPGELHVGVMDDGSDRLTFGVDVVDDEGGKRYTVTHTRVQVCGLVNVLEKWLDGRCDDGS